MPCCSPVIDDDGSPCRAGRTPVELRRDPVACGPMRPATTLAIGLLLAAILIAGVIALLRI